MSNNVKKCKILKIGAIAVPLNPGFKLEAKHYDVDHIRLWTSGSAPLLVKNFQRITHILGKPPVEREGMSETGMNFSNPLRGQHKPGSIGLPLPGVQARIVDPKTFADLPQGQVGEI